MTRAERVARSAIEDGRASALAWCGALLVLLASVAVYFWPVWAGSVSFLVGDNLTHSLPMNARLSSALHGGGFRFWDPDVAFGAPTYADGTGGWFHPWKLLLFATFPLLTAHNLLYVSSFLLTGVSCLFAGAMLGVRPSVALASAIAVTFSPTVLGNCNNAAYAHGVAWTGVWLVAFECWYASPTSRRVAGLAFATALALLAGYPPMAYAQLLLLGTMLAIRLAFDRRRLAAHVLGLPAAVALGLAVSAFQVLPLAELATHSVRQEAVAPLNSFPWMDYVAGLVFVNDPELYAPGRFRFFLAPLGSALGILAVASLPLLRGRIGVSYIGAIAVCVAAAGGPGAPVFEALRSALPGFDRLRLLSPFLYVTIVPLGVLVALLLESALSAAPSRRQLAICMGLLAAFVVAMAASLPGRAATPQYRLPGGLALSLACAGILLPRLLGWPASASALWLAALLEVGTSKASYLSYLPDSILSEGNEIAARLAVLRHADPEARGIHLSSPQLDNIVKNLLVLHWKMPGYAGFARACLRMQVPYINLPAHLPFAEANDALSLAGVPTLRQTMQAELRRERLAEPGDRMLDRYGVRFEVVLGDLGRTPIADGFDVVWRDPSIPISVLANAHVQPRYRFQPPTGASEPTVAQPIPAWQDWIDALPWVAAESEGPVEIVAPAPGRIFAAIPYYPGWTARLDGEPVRPLLAADGVGTEIPVSAGAHKLELRFTPYSFHLGLLVAAPSALVLLALAARRTCSSGDGQIRPGRISVDPRSSSARGPPSGVGRSVRSD